MISQQALLDRIRRGNAKLLGELRQLLRCGEWWNNHRTDEAPIDIEAERLLIPLLEKRQRVLDAHRVEDGPIDLAESFDKIMDIMESNGWSGSPQGDSQ